MFKYVWNEETRRPGISILRVKETTCTVPVLVSENLVHNNHSEIGHRPFIHYSFHQAAVKALAWCPWRPNVLASGGGTNDRHIRMWNITLGSLLCETDTKSQVTALIWSEEYKELISAHGHVSNQLIIWKFPSMEKVAQLEGHEARVLDMSLSPDKTTVVSAGADETLRIWKCFAVDGTRKKTKAKKENPSATRSALSTLMR